MVWFIGSSSLRKKVPGGVGLCCGMTRQNIVESVLIALESQT